MRYFARSAILTSEGTGAETPIPPWSTPDVAGANRYDPIIHPTIISVRPENGACILASRNYTPEEREYIRWERKTERQIERHLRAAYDLAIQRHGHSYASHYLDGTLWQVVKENPPPRDPPSYRKKAIGGTLRTRVFERDGYRCKTCGGWQELCADHIIPELLGGETTYENLQTLCRSCNAKKGARP